MVMHVYHLHRFCIVVLFRIPETPLKKIQEYNNFRHSTYTPTQSTEDLTKLTEDTRTSTPNSPPAKTARVSQNTDKHHQTGLLTVEINSDKTNNDDNAVNSGKKAHKLLDDVKVDA